MSIYVAKAEDDEMYLFADSEEEAYQKLNRIVGGIPRGIATFDEIDAKDVPEDEEIL